MRNKILVVIGLVIAISLFSCGNKPKDLQNIPNSTDFVFTVNLQQLMDKSGVDNFSETKMYDLVFDGDSSKSISELKKFDYIFKDKEQSGVNFKTQLFVYGMSNKGGWQTSMAVNFGLLDADKFETLLNKSISSDGDSISINENANIKYLISSKEGNRSIIAWDNKLAVIYTINKGYCTNELLIERTKSIIELSMSNSIANNKSFVEFYENKKDVSVWFNSSFALNKLPKDYNAMVNMQLPFNPQGIEYRYYISFEKGYIQSESELILPDELHGFLDRYKIIKSDFDNDILEYIPGNSMVNFSVAINAHELYRMIKGLYKERQMNVDGIESMMNGSMDMEIEKLFEAINGEVVFNIHDIDVVDNISGLDSNTLKPTKSTKFKASLLIKLDNKELYTWFLKQFNDNEAEMINGYYILNESGDVLYVSMVDSIMMITNDVKVIEGFVAKQKQNPSLKDTEVAKHLNNYSLFAMLNLDYSTYSSDVQDYYNRNYLKHDKAKIYSKLKEIRFQPVDSYHSKVIMELNDNTKNSLEVLFN